MQTSQAKPLKKRKSRITRADPVLWLTQLDRAVHHGNEPEIWRLVESHQPKDQAYRILAKKLSRINFLRETDNVWSRIYGELIFIPLLASHTSKLITNTAIRSPARVEIRRALADWFRDGSWCSLFAEVLPLDKLIYFKPSAWQVLMRQFMQQGSQSKIMVPNQTIDLPSNVPQLGFIIIGRSAEFGWRDMPKANGIADLRLQELIKYSLLMHAQDGDFHENNAATVLAPQRMHEAITSGICFWLRRMHEVVGIEGWMLLPCLNEHEVLKVTLKLGSSEVQHSQFLLRLHEVGWTGLHQILNALQEIAPLLDAPSDIEWAPPKLEIIRA
jgi:hypothetical protein